MLGADLRAIRKTRDMTLAQVSGRMGRSVGWLSQIERDISHLSPREALDLACILDISPSLLDRPAQPDGEAGRIVRANARRRVGARIEGLTETLVSPDLTDPFEIIHSVFAPGECLPAPVRRATHEIGYVMAGRLDLTIGETTHALGPGDSFRIRDEPYLWANPYPKPAILLWVISPPVY